MPWKRIGLDTSEPMVSANRASSNRTLVDPGNSSSDGGHEKKHTISVGFRDMNKEDGVKETFQEGVLPGTGPREEQLRPGRNQATARMKWIKGVNKLIIKCYIKSSQTY